MKCYYFGFSRSSVYSAGKRLSVVYLYYLSIHIKFNEHICILCIASRNSELQRDLRQVTIFVILLE